MIPEIVRDMSVRDDSTAETLAVLKERAGMSLAKIAKAMGYSGASSIQRYFQADGTKGTYLHRDIVEKFATALVGQGDPPITEQDVWQLAGPELAQVAAPNALLAGPVDTFGKRIPVYGSAVGGKDGEFLMNGSALYEVMSPPSLMATKGAYAVQVSGESMEPRYFDGEVVYVDPTRRVTKGDFVIAQIQVDEHGTPWAFVKRLVRRNAVELVLSQFNPEKEMTFPGDKVVSVHYIVMGGRV